MSFLEDIDKGLKKMGKSLEEEDKKNIRTDCPYCGKKDILINKMKARHGHTKCPECGAQLVIMMERN